MQNLITIIISMNLFFLSSCIDKNNVLLASNDTDKIPVSWYSGYKMPELLAKNVKVNTIKDIREIIDKEWYAEFSVVDPAKPEITFPISSCGTYIEQANEELYPLPLMDYAAFLYITTMCDATNIIANGKPARKTFLNTFKFNDSLPDTLPAQLALIISVSESKRLLSNKSIKYWSQITKISSTVKIGPNHVKYIDESGTQELELVARGDFNGDGIEDMLITSHDSVKGGSYSATRLFLLTRLTLKGDIIFLKQWPSS